MIYINENKRHNNHCRLFILLFNNLVEKVGISLDVTLLTRVFQGRFLQIGGKGTEFIVHVLWLKMIPSAYWNANLLIFVYVGSFKSATSFRATPSVIAFSPNFSSSFPSNLSL